MSIGLHAEHCNDVASADGKHRLTQFCYVNHMQKQHLYENRIAGRRPMTLFGFVICVVGILFGISQNAPWYFLAPVGFAAAMMIWQLIRNPVNGAEVTAVAVHFFSGRMDRVVKLSDVRAMRITRWSDGPPNVELQLHKGPPVAVPSICIDGRFISVLSNLGIVETNAKVPRR